MRLTACKIACVILLPFAAFSDWRADFDDDCAAVQIVPVVPAGDTWVTILNLLAQWKMNDNSANTTVIDSKGANTGVSARSTSVLSVSGKIDSAITFNGSSDKIDLNGTLLSGQERFSIFAWIFPLSNNAYRRVFSKTNSSNYNQLLRMTNTGKLQGCVATSTEKYITGGTTITTGVWHSVCVTYNGANINLYLDGAVDAVPVSHSGALKTAGDVAQIGMERTIAELWHGHIDSLRIYSEALTLSQIQALHNTPTEAE